MEISESDKAYKKIISLSAYRDRSFSDLRKRLAKEGFSEVAIEDSLEKARVSGIVSDTRFAECYIRSKFAAGWGCRGILKDLEGMDLEVDLDTIDCGFEFPCAETEEIGRALDILNRKPIQAKNVRSSAYRRLASKGYASSVCSSAVSEYMNDKQF